MVENYELQKLLKYVCLSLSSRQYQPVPDDPENLYRIFERKPASKSSKSEFYLLKDKLMHNQFICLLPFELQFSCLEFCASGYLITYFLVSDMAFLNCVPFRWCHTEILDWPTCSRIILMGKEKWEWSSAATPRLMNMMRLLWVSCYAVHEFHANL